jgi:mannose-1-phosphate guanylyltransferase/mannose-6-phosphate isomerase
MLIPLILSGGSGTRLWPVSRKNLPKQFLAWPATARCSSRPSHGPGSCLTWRPRSWWPAKITAFLAADQLLEAGVEGATIVLEPLARNTAPAIALGALQALQRDADALLLVLPADHLIGDTGAFVEAVKQAMPLAKQGWLVTFGIRPDRPETGFGYIRRAEASMAMATGGTVRREARPGHRRVLSRRWRLRLELGHVPVQGLALSGRTRPHAPAMLAAVRNAHAKASADLDFVRIDRDAFALVPDNRSTTR